MNLRQIIYILITTLILAACTAESDIPTGDIVLPQESEGAVVFSAYSARTTRTAASEDPITEVAGLANAGGFGVFAYEHGTVDFYTYSTAATYPNFFFNQQVYGSTLASTTGHRADGGTSYDENASVTWEYSPIKYYSNNTGARHSFFAYAPYSDFIEPVFNLGSTPQVRYSMTQNYDLLWAQPVMDKLKPGVTETIKFSFNHALSKARFHVAPFIDRVHSDGSHGTTTAPTSAVLPKDTKVNVRSIRLSGVVPSTALLNIGTGEWTVETSNKSYFITDATTATWTGADPAVEPQYINLSPVKFIPSSDLKIEVTYDIVSGTGDNAVHVTNHVTSLETFSLEAGKVYDFYLDLGLTSVQFDATVSAWANDSHNVDLPNNMAFNLIECAKPLGTTSPTAKTITETDANSGDIAGGYYWCNTDKNMYSVSSNTWTLVTTAAIYYDTASKRYYDVAASGYTTVYTAEYACINSAYYNGTTPLTPTSIYSLNVNSEGKIQTGADRNLPGSWTSPVENDYYLFGERLYQWKSAVSH